MKQRQAIITSNRLPDRRLACRSHRVRGGAALLLLALIALHGLAPSTLGQDPAPNVLSIDVTRPLSQPLQYRFPGQTPRAETEIEFKGNGRDWSFVRFDQIPENTSLRIRGLIAGYMKAESLQTRHWYPFKNLLPVVLEIKPEARMPVEFVYSSGSLSSSALEEIRKNPDMRLGDIRRFAAQNQITQATDRQVLRFLWEHTISISTGNTAKPTVTKINDTQVDDPATHSWWTYLVYDYPLIGLLVLLLVVSLPIFAWQFFWRDLIRGVTGKQGQASMPDEPAADPDPYDALGGETETGTARKGRLHVGKAEPASQLKVVGYVTGEDPAAAVEKQHVRERPARPSRLADLLNPTEKPPVKTETKDKSSRAESAPVTAQPPASLYYDASRVRHELDQMGRAMDSRFNEMKQQFCEAFGTHKRADEQMTAWQQKAEEKMTQLVGVLENEVNEIRRELAAMRKEQSELDARQQAGMKNFWKETADRFKALGMELNEVRGGLDKLGEGAERTDVPDSFYARTLGVILGQNLEALRDGNFEELSGRVCERLNQFFQTEVPHGDKLQALSARAVAIHIALKDVLAQMEKLNPQAAKEAGQHLQRAAALADELSALQSQLQNRRATIETTLRIPVSMHAGARQTFLDELGRGLRREIDKLSEPQSHYVGELKRLITADLIAVVDACDKKIASPGVRPELDAVLDQLFVQAGLLPILPRMGEPFKSFEHELIERLQGGKGQSMAIARVIRRGFYYEQRDGKTLLRKAGVAVYR